MKILVPDTTGGNISQAYRNLLPNITIRGISHPANVGDHPHGAWCGWLAAAPLQAVGGKHELVFLQILHNNGTFANFEEILLETIAKERPDYISMSWGSWDRQDKQLAQRFQTHWEPFAQQFSALRQEIGFVAFAAAGNNDKNNATPDVAYPQRILPDQLYIVGSTNAQGIPSTFSADGPVHTVAIGEQCLSPDASGAWHLWRGTSAACPKVCGSMAARGLTHDEVHTILLADAEHPPAWTDRRPHPKWGYGSVEFLWQNDVAQLPPSLRPPRNLRGVQSLYAQALDGLQ